MDFPELIGAIKIFFDFVYPVITYPILIPYLAVVLLALHLKHLLARIINEDYREAVWTINRHFHSRPKYRKSPYRLPSRLYTNLSLFLHSFVTHISCCYDP
jgi:hypothetical protein